MGSLHTLRWGSCRKDGVINSMSTVGPSRNVLVLHWTVTREWSVRAETFAARSGVVVGPFMRRSDGSQRIQV